MDSFQDKIDSLLLASQWKALAVDAANDLELSPYIEESVEPADLAVTVLGPSAPMIRLGKSPVYRAHLDEMIERINDSEVFAPEMIFEPTRAEVLASALEEFDRERLNDPEQEATNLDYFAVWLLLDIFDGKDYAPHSLMRNDVFEGWTDEMQETMEENEERFVEEVPRDLFIAGRRFDFNNLLDSDLQLALSI